MAITIIIVGIISGSLAVVIALMLGASYWTVFLVYPLAGTAGAIVAILFVVWCVSRQDQSSEAVQTGC